MCTEIDLDSVESLPPFAWAGVPVERALWNGRSIERLETLGAVDQQIVALQLPWFFRPFEMIGRGLFDPDLFDPNSPLPQCELSMHFETAGSTRGHFRIEGINGMQTQHAEATAHASYLSSFTPNQSIGWVYNRTHSLVSDVGEVFFMNYLGYSPNTSKLLLNNWRSFHKENRANPGVKCLQFCHSQGAIHVKNALLKASVEVRNCVIVVAIAPAVVVPEKLCYQSFNYASKRDIVHLGELLFLGAFDTNEFRMAKPLEMALEYRKELVFLEAHPLATGIDHDFQSPTFREKIADHIAAYLEKNGAYL